MEVHKINRLLLLLYCRMQSASDDILRLLQSTLVEYVWYVVSYFQPIYFVFVCLDVVVVVVASDVTFLLVASASLPPFPMDTWQPVQLNVLYRLPLISLFRSVENLILVDISFQSIFQ